MKCPNPYRRSADTPLRADFLTLRHIRGMRAGQVEVAQIIHQDGIPDPGDRHFPSEPFVGVLLEVLAVWLKRAEELVHEQPIPPDTWLLLVRRMQALQASLKELQPLVDGWSESAADFLANSGIPTLIDAQHAIAHNKVIIIDGETVIGGSFNYTKAAQDKNAENVEITRDKAVAAKYTENWQAHARHSEPYVGRGIGR